MQHTIDFKVTIALDVSSLIQYIPQIAQALGIVIAPRFESATIAPESPTVQPVAASPVAPPAPSSPPAEAAPVPAPPQDVRKRRARTASVTPEPSPAPAVSVTPAAPPAPVQTVTPAPVQLPISGFGSSPAAPAAVDDVTPVSNEESRALKADVINTFNGLGGPEDLAAYTKLRKSVSDQGFPGTKDATGLLILQNLPRVTHNAFKVELERIAAGR